MMLYVVMGVLLVMSVLEFIVGYAILIVRAVRKIRRSAA